MQFELNKEREGWTTHGSPRYFIKERKKGKGLYIRQLNVNKAESFAFDRTECQSCFTCPRFFISKYVREQKRKTSQEYKEKEN